MSKINDAIENLEIAEFNNRKIVLSTKDGTPMRIQFPRLYMPFGVSGFTPEVGPTKYNVDLALKGHDEEGSYIKKFYESLKQIESKIIDAVVDQSQSMNLFMESPTMSKLSSMHMYAWKKGLKTGMYYLRSKAKARPIQFSLEPECVMCSA